MIGYDPHYKTRNEKEDGDTVPAEWRALIIPTGWGSFIARNIDEPKEAAKKNRYRKKGTSLLFNSKNGLKETDKPIFIVEGEIDALSIIEAGGQAVGLGSTSNYTKLIEKVKQEAPAQPLILSLDRDDEGQKTEEKIAEELTALQIPFYRLDIYGEAKDANEALLTDREAFIAEIENAAKIQEEEAEAAREAMQAEYMKTSAADKLQLFLNGIDESINTPAISTGYDNLDCILDGGLYKGLYILGGISSMGKTTLLLNLADKLAQIGQDVLIFTLEMGRDELIAKSISRLTYENVKAAGGDTRNAKTARGITAGARYANYSNAEKAIINKAITDYKEYAPHLFIHEGIGDIGVEQIKETVNRHISITGRKPVVFIDYLQVLAPYDLRASDKQNTDKNVLELRRLSRDYSIPVIATSSFNRDSYKTGGGINQGRVSMTDFKESGAIEYSADVLIGLEFESAGTKEYDEKAEKQKKPRQIRLVILKQRNGETYTSTDFNYYAMFNCFEEKGFIEDTEGEGADVFKDLRGMAK